MIRPDPRRFARSRRARLIGASSAGVIIWSLATAAYALPAGFDPVMTTGGTTTIDTSVAGTLTVNQGGDRVVIDWSTFNIDTGETVTFNQPNANAIAFNRVDPTQLTTIDGALNSNGGVWLFSPGGLLFGANATVNVGSFVGSTAQLSNADAAAALTGNSVTLSPLAARNGANLTVSNGASLTATNGFMVLQGETIVQNGQVVSNTDAVWYGVAEGGQVTFTPGTGLTGPALADGTVHGVDDRGQPSFTQGSTGVTTAQTWVGVSTPGVGESGWDSIINLGGSITALGIKPGSTQGVVILTGQDGVADLTNVSTTIDTSAATIVANADVVMNGTDTTLGDVQGYLIDIFGGAITVDGDVEAVGSTVSLSGPAGVTITSTGEVTAASNVNIYANGLGGDIDIQGAVYGSQITVIANDSLNVDGTIIGQYLDLSTSVGSATIGSTADLQGSGSSTPSIQITGHTDLTIEDGASITSVDDMTLYATTGDLSIAGDIDADYLHATAGDDLTFTGAQTLTLNQLQVNAGGDVDIAGDVHAPTTLSIQADGDINLGATADLSSFSVGLTAGNHINSVAGSSIDGDGGVGTIQLLAYGSDGLTSAIDLSGDITGYNIHMVATAGSITLTDGTFTADQNFEAQSMGGGFTTLSGSAVDAENASILAAGDAILGGSISADYAYVRSSGGIVDVTGSIYGLEAISLRSDLAAVYIQASAELEIGAGFTPYIDIYGRNLVYTATGSYIHSAAGDASASVNISANGFYGADSIVLLGDIYTGDVDLTTFSQANIRLVAGTTTALGDIDISSNHNVGIEAGATLNAGDEVNAFANGNMTVEDSTTINAAYVDLEISNSVNGALMQVDGDINAVNTISIENQAGDVVIGSNADLHGNTDASVDNGGPLGHQTDTIEITGQNITTYDGSQITVGNLGDSYRGTVYIHSDDTYASGPTQVTLDGYIQAEAVGVYVDDGSLDLSGHLYTTGALVFDVSGTVTMDYTGLIVADGYLNITAGDGIELDGTVRVDGDIDLTTLNADADINIRGDLYAYGAIELTSAADINIYTGAALQSDSNTYGADGFIGLYAAYGNITTEVGSSLIVGNTGDTTGDVIISAGGTGESIHLGGSIYAEGLGLIATYGSIHMTYGDIYVDDSLAINVAYDFIMDGPSSIHSGGDVDISAQGTLQVGGAIYSDGNVSLYRYGGVSDDLIVGGHISAYGNVSIVNNYGDIAIGGDIYGSAVTVRTPYDGDISIGATSYIGATGDILVEGHYSGGSGDIFVDGVMIADGDISVRNYNGELYIGADAALYSASNIELYRDGSYTDDLLSYGLLHANGHIDIINSGDGNVVLAGTIVADADADAYPGYIYIASQGQVLAYSGGLLLVGSTYGATGDVTINAAGGDNPYSSAIDIDLDIDAEGLYLNAGSGSIHLAGGTITLENDLNITAGAAFLMDSDATINDDGSINITAATQILAYGQLSAGYDVYLHLSDTLSNGDLAVADITAGNAIHLVNDGSGDVLISAGANLNAGASPYGYTPEIDIVSNGQVISYAGSSLIVGAADSPTGDVAIHAYGGDGTYSAIDLYSDISALHLTLDAPNGSIHLGDGDIYVLSTLTLYSTYDITIDAPVSIDTTYDVDIEALGALTVNGDVRGADIDFTSGSDLTVGGDVTGTNVTLNASGDLTIGAGADILAYGDLNLNMNAPGDMLIYGDLDADYIDLVNPYGDILIAGELSGGYDYGGVVVHISAAGDLTVTNTGDIHGDGNIELETTGATSSLTMDGEVSGYGVTIQGSNDVAIGGNVYAYDNIYIGSDATTQNDGSITIDGTISTFGGIAVVNRNTGGVTFGANADVYTVYFEDCVECYGLRTTPGGTTSLQGMDGDIYIYSATYVHTVAGSVIDATQGLGSDSGLVVIRANGADTPAYSAIDLAGDIVSYETYLYADNGSIHLADGTISVTDGFYALAADGFSIDAGAVIDGTTAGNANIDIYAGGDIDLAGSISGYYVHIQTDGGYDGSADIDVTGYVYATDQIELFNFANDIHIGATGELYVGNPQENGGPEIFVQAGDYLTTDAGSYIHTLDGDVNGYVSLRADSDTGVAIGLAGDVSSGGDVRVQVSGYGELDITGGTINAGGDFYAATYGQIQITGGVINADESAIFTSGNNMLLAGAIYAGDMSAHIYGGEASYTPGASIEIDGRIEAETYIGIFNEVGAVELSSNAVLSANTSDAPAPSGASVRIEGESVTSDAGSLIETPAGNAGSQVLIQAFAATGTTVDLQGDIDTGGLTINSFVDGGVVIGGDINALDDIEINAAGMLTIQDTAVLDAGDVVDLQSDQNMLIAGDVYGTYIRANIYGGEGGSGIDGASMTVDGNLYADQTIELNNEVGDVEIGAGAQVLGNLGGYSSQSYQNHFVQIYGENITTGAGSLIASGPDGARQGDVVLGTYNYYGDPTLVDLSGDIDAQSVLFDIQNGSLRQRAGTVSAASPITIDVDGYFQTDDGASIYSGGDVRVTSQGGMTVNGDITADRIFLTDYSAYALVVGGTLQTGSDINIHSVNDDVHLTSGALLFADTDYFAPDVTYNHVYLEAGGQVRTDAGSSIQVGSLADPHGTVEITAHGIDGGVYSAIDLSGDISAQNLSLQADVGSIRLRDGDVSVTNGLDIDTQASFIMDAPATIYSGGDVSVDAVDNLTVTGQITALGDIGLTLTGPTGGMTLNGILYAGDDIDIDNQGSGQVVIGGGTLVADYDGDNSDAHLNISSDGSIVAPGGGVLRVGEELDAHGTIYLYAAGPDGTDAAIDLNGMTISADTVHAVADDGSIHLGTSTNINAGDTITIDADGRVDADADTVLNSGGDVNIDAYTGIDLAGLISASDQVDITLHSALIIGPGPGQDGFTAGPGDIVMSGVTTAGGSIDVSNYQGDIYVSGIALADNDGLAPTYGYDHISLRSSYGLVVTGVDSRLQVGQDGTPTGNVFISAFGDDTGAYSSVDLSGDITADHLNILAGESIHLANGDIDVVDSVFFGAYAYFFMDASATLTSGGDVTIVATDGIQAMGNITSGGDIYLHLDPDAVFAGFVAGAGDIQVGGDMTADGAISIVNEGVGDVYIDGAAVLHADADGVGEYDNIFIDSNGQVISAAGSSMIVGQVGATTGGVYIYAGGDDNASYSSVDLAGDIDADSLYVTTDGSIHLRDGDITLSGDLFLGTYLDFVMDAPASIDAAGDVTIVAVRSLQSRGDITSGGDIYLHLDPDAYFEELFTAGPGDLVVGGNLTADGSIDIVNDGSGDLYVDGTATLHADADSAGLNEGITLESDGQVISAAGSTMVVGEIGATTGGVNIYANGADNASYSSVDLSGDIDADSLYVSTDGSIHLRDGDIVLSGDLFLATYVDFLMDAPATIDAAGDVTIVARRTIDSEGDITSGGTIYLHLDPDAYFGSAFTAGPGDLVVGGTLTANDSIDIVNEGSGDIYLNGTAALTADADSTGGPDHIQITSEGQVISASGSTMVVGAADAPTGNVGIDADGADNATYSAIDLSGDISAIDVTLDTTTGSVHLAAGDISAANDVIIHSAGGLYTDAGSTVATEGDIFAYAAGAIDLGGRWDSGFDLRIFRTGSGAADITVTGELYADADLQIAQQGPGNVLLDGASLRSDDDNYGTGDVTITSTGQIRAVSGGSITAGPAGAPTNTVTLTANGGDTPGASAIDLDIDIEAATLNLNTTAGSIHLAGGTITVVNDLTLTSNFDVITGDPSVIIGGGNVIIDANRNVVVDGDVTADGNIDFFAGNNLTTGGTIQGDNVYLTGDDLVLDGTIIANNGDVFARAYEDLYVDGSISASDDVRLSADYDLYVYGSVTAGDQVAVTVFGGEGDGDILIDGSVSAGSDLYVTNQSGGDITLGSNASLVADMHGNSPGAYLDIYGHGFITAYEGSSIHVGAADSRSGYVTIYTDGGDGEGYAAIYSAANIDAGTIEITAAYGSVEIGGASTVAADESITIYAANDFILGEEALISGAENRETDLPKPSGVVVYAAYDMGPGVSIAAGDVDIQGHIVSGDIIAIGAYNVSGGQVTVGGADDGLGTGFTLSNAEFQNLSADSIVILAGQGAGYSGESGGYDLHIGDLTIDFDNVDDVWFGSQENIIVDGDVTPSGDGVNVHLGFVLAFTAEDDFSQGVFPIGFVPQDIYISGSLGSVDNPFGSVTLVAQGDILMGSSEFIAAALADPEFSAAEQGDDLNPEEGHVFVASDVLQMASNGGRILQQDTAEGTDFGGLVIGLPQPGQELIFVPDQLEGLQIGGTGGFLADFSQGPSKIELYGYFVGENGETVTGFQAAGVDNLLDPEILIGEYFINNCQFYSEECGSGEEGEIPVFHDPFPPVEPQLDPGDLLTFFTGFPFEEPDDEDDDDEIQGEPVTGSGNEDLWTMKPTGVRP